MQASIQALHLAKTCLNISDEQRATRSFALYAFFNNGIMDFVITFAADDPSSSANSPIVIIGVGDF